MATLSAQSLQSFTVAVGPGTTKELDTALGAAASLTTTVNTLDAFKTEITTAYTANLSANSFNGNHFLVDGNLSNLSDGTTATISWEAVNQILVTGIAATPTITGATGASPGGLIVGAASRRLGFYGATAVARPSITQTYSTATTTHTAMTAAALTVADGAGTNNGTIEAITNNATTIAAVQELADQINKLVTDLTETKKIVNGVVDNLQSLGLFG